MPTTPEAISADIAEAATAGFRGRLIARGQARAIIWRDGALPPDAPAFAPQLSYDLRSYGYALLGLGLRLRELGGDPDAARTAFEQAATALEAVMAKGNRQEVDRDFHFVMAAASYHLAHLSARAYSLLAIVQADENFAPTERMLALLMRRDFRALQAAVLDYRASGRGSDARIAADLQATLDQAEAAEALPDADNDFLFDGVDTALTDGFMAGISLFLLALERGERPLVDQALARLNTGLSVCGELNMLPQWWAHRIAIHLLSDLWSSTFHEKVPLQPAGGEAADWPRLRELFIALMQRRAKAEVDLWPSQIEAAARAVDQTDDLVVSLPTSAGKPGAIMAFQEHARCGLPAGLGPLILHRRLYDWMWNTVAAEGGDVGLALRLTELIQAAGFSIESANSEGILLRPGEPPFLPTLARVMLPRMVERGVLKPEDVDLDTLADQMEDERNAAAGLIVWDLAVLVSARKD